MIVNAVPNCVQNLFCNISTLLEQPLLLSVIVTVVCSECDIFVCFVCTGYWCIFIMFVMCANSDITCLYVIPVDCHIVVSVSCTLLVIKTQCMQQLVFNCPQSEAPSSRCAGFEIQLLAL